MYTIYDDFAYRAVKAGFKVRKIRTVQTVRRATVATCEMYKPLPSKQIVNSAYEIICTEPEYRWLSEIHSGPSFKLSKQDIACIQGNTLILKTQDQWVDKWEDI